MAPGVGASVPAGRVTGDGFPDAGSIVPPLGFGTCGGSLAPGLARAGRSLARAGSRSGPGQVAPQEQKREAVVNAPLAAPVPAAVLPLLGHKLVGAPGVPVRVAEGLQPIGDRHPLQSPEEIILITLRPQVQRHRRASVVADEPSQEAESIADNGIMSGVPSRSPNRGLWITGVRVCAQRRFILQPPVPSRAQASPRRSSTRETHAILVLGISTALHRRCRGHSPNHHPGSGLCETGLRPSEAIFRPEFHGGGPPPQAKVANFVLELSLQV